MSKIKHNQDEKASKKKASKKQRYFRVDKVEQMKKDGWKVVNEKMAHGRQLNVRVHQSDLVLMEK